MRTPALLWIGVALLVCISANAAGNSEQSIALAGDDIVIGQSADLSHRHAHVTRQFLAGANAYFDQINSKGGIGGRQIKIVSLDDKGDPVLAIRNTQQLLHTDKILALFGYVSYQTSNAVLPWMGQTNAAFFAPLTGARLVYDSFSRHVFTIRASYADEYSYLFSHFSRIGMKRVAIFTDAPDVPSKFAMQTLIDSAQSELVAAESAVGPGLEEMADNLIRARPDIILVMSTSPALNAPLIRLLRAKGYLGYFHTTSHVYSILDDAARQATDGMIVSQTLPFPWKNTVPIVREYQQAMRQIHPGEFSYLGLEGFIAARVLAEGIKRAGPIPTREKLIAALESINERNYDGLGHRINFSKSNHHGSTYVDLTTITKAGFFAH